MSVPTSTSGLLSEPQLLAAVARAADALDVFHSVEIVGRRVECAALDSAEPAVYRFDLSGDSPSISLVTPARYLSQSIEADLVHTGDKLDDLLADELVEAGYAGPPLQVEHFRDPEKLFTFRSRLSLSEAERGSDQGARTIVQALQAYEACFRVLGDMSSSGEEE